MQVEVFRFPAPANAWRKSSRSQAQNGCVEIASIEGEVGVRDTKLGESSPVLLFGAHAWTAFAARVREGELDA